MKRVLIVTRRIVLTCAAVLSFFAATAIAQPYAVGYRDVALNPYTTIRLYYPAMFAGDQAPIVKATGAPYPTVAFECETGVDRDAYRYLIDHLVSRGYLVAIPRPSQYNDLLRGRLLANIITSLYYAANYDTTSGLVGQVGLRGAIGGHGSGGTAAFYGAIKDSTHTVLFTLGAIANVDAQVLDEARNVDDAMLTVSGTHDCIAPDSANAMRLHDALGSSCKSRAVLNGASHCRFAQVDLNCQTSEAECTVSATMAREEQLRVVDSLVLPWLDWQLKDDCGAIERFREFIDSSRSITVAHACDDPGVRFSLAPNDRLVICPSQQVMLSAPEGYSRYEWSNGATTRSIRVTAGESYSVVAHDSAKCTMRSSTTWVYAKYYAPRFGARKVICPGSYVVLDPRNPYAEYLWSTGDRTPTLEVHEPGRYWVEWTFEGCTLMSDTVEVIAIARPRVGVDGALVACTGDSVRLDAPMYMSNMNWSDGSHEFSKSVSKSGAFYFTGIDSNGCLVTSDTVVVVRNVPIKPTISVRSDTLISSPANSYQWLRDDIEIAGASERMYIARIAGRYSVRTIDSNGCAAQSPAKSVAVGAIASDMTSNMSLRLDGRLLHLTLSCVPDAAVRVTVTDLRGARVWSDDVVEHSSGGIAADLSGLASGVYIVIVDCGNERILSGPIRLE